MVVTIINFKYKPGLYRFIKDYDKIPEGTIIKIVVSDDPKFTVEAIGMDLYEVRSLTHTDSTKDHEWLQDTITIGNYVYKPIDLPIELIKEL